MGVARVYPTDSLTLSWTACTVRAGAHLESRDSPNEFPAPGKLDRKSLGSLEAARQCPLDPLHFLFNEFA